MIAQCYGMGQGIGANMRRDVLGYFDIKPLHCVPNITNITFTGEYLCKETSCNIVTLSLILGGNSTLDLRMTHNLT